QVLLETTDYSISDIAALVGYNNPLYFSRLFRYARGLSPARYRKVFREQFMAEFPPEE
ncbi:MAG: AraC family transcriptional regulator, partial [Lachnospiraceae bacterium]|nr:AraC family transcriptional regulator [Lachnospiraceae bacterium]